MNLSLHLPMCSNASGRLSRRGLIGAALAFAGAATSHAQTPEVADAPSTRIPLLRVAVRGYPGEVVPQDATDLERMWLSSLVYDAPFRWNQAGDVLAGVFGRVYQRSSRLLLLEPRRGARLSDGTPVTSHLVLDALQQIQDSQYAWRLQRMRDASVRADGLLEMVLDRPNVALTAQLAHPLFGLGKSHYSTGPFLFASLEGDVALYSRNPWFWQIGRPHIDALEVHRIRDDTRRSTAFVTGEVDLLPNAPLLDVPMLAADPDVYLVGGPSNRLCHVQLRLSHPVLQQKRVRQILSAVIDRTRLVNGATAQQAELADTLLPPGPWRDDVDSFANISLNEAAKELRELGVPADLRLHLVTDNTDSTLANTAVLLQEQLAGCGISLSISLLEDVELQSAKDTQSYDLLVAYSEPWRDPHELLWPLLASTGPLNGSGYDRREVDYLLEAAISLPNMEFRRRRYSHLEGLVRRDVPCIPLFRPYVWDAVRQTIPGYAALPPVTSRGLMTVMPTDSP